MSIEHKISEALGDLRDVMLVKSAHMGTRLEGIERLAGVGAPSGDLGELLTRAAGYEAFVSGQRNMLKVDVSAEQLKSAESYGPALSSHWAPIGEGSRRRRWVRDLLASERTEHASVEFPHEEGFANAADSQDGAGSTLAQSGLTFGKKHNPVETIGHWVHASKEVLADPGAMNAFIRSRMIYGVRLVEEQQILTGNGINGKLLGILAPGNFEAFNRAVAEDDKLQTLSRAMAQVEANDFQPNGFVIHPDDWETIRPMLDTTQGYSLWRLPVVVTNAIPSGTFLAGDFARGAVLFERQAATIEMTSNHEGDFTNGMVAIRATVRSALVVPNPTALVSGQF